MFASRTQTTTTTSSTAGPLRSRPVPSAPANPAIHEDDEEEILVRKGKGKEKAKAQPVGGDPDDSGDGDNDEDNDGKRAPCEQCRSKKIPCQMQAGKRSLIILVKCKGVVNLTGKRLVVLESQMA
ncbi:hypothetical protein F5879DRAFT_989594 [Lentinula edodes]|nr:hypothetical protein F5879DRAFT_989594 [Lentinula edodes]